MAASVREILLKWGIDNSNWKSAIQELGSKLEDANKKSAAAASKSLKQLDQYKQKLQEAVEARKSESAVVQAQIDQYKIITAQQKAAVATAQAQVAQQRAITAQLVAQTAQLRLQAAQQRASVPPRRPTGGAGGGGGTGGGGGGFGTFMGGIGGALGGSLFGATLTGAVAAGTAIEEILSGMISKVKEFIVSSGPLQEVREQFEKLSALNKIDPAKFLDDMRKATRGLVNDTVLYRTANQAMQSGIKVSESQIVATTQAVVGLARAQGRDATAAVNALNRGFTTGRFMTLGYLTGLQRVDLQVHGLGATITDTARKQAEFDKASQALIARFKAVGEPAITLTDRLEQISVASTRFFQTIALSAAGSGGMKILMDMLGGVIDNFGKMDKVAEKVGSTIGTFLGTMAEWAKTGREVFSTLSTGMGNLVSNSQKLASAFGADSGTLGFIGHLLTLKGLMTEIGKAAILARSGFEQLAAVFDYVQAGPLQSFNLGLAKTVSWLLRDDAGTTDAIDRMLDKWTNAAAKANQTNLDKLKSQSQSIMDHAAIDMADFEAKMKAAGMPTSGPAAKQKPSDEESEALQKEMVSAREKLATAEAKIKYDAKKAELEQEKELEQASYEAGISDLKSYTAQQLAIQAQLHSIRLQEIQEEADAKKAQLKQQIASGQVDPKVGALQLQTINAEMTDSIAKESQSDNKAVFDIYKKQLADYVSAEKTTAEEILKVRKETLESEKAALEKDFANGNLTAQAYLQARLGIIQSEYQLEVQAANEKYASEAKSAKSFADLQAQLGEAAANKEKEITALVDSEYDTREKSIKTYYDNVTKMLEDQLKSSEGVGGIQSSGQHSQEQAALQALLAITEKRVATESQLLSLLTPQTSEWYKQEAIIAGLNDQALKYKEQLIQTQTFGKQAAGVMASIGDALSESGVKASGLVQGFQNASSILEKVGAAQDNLKKLQLSRVQAKSGQAVTPEEVTQALNKATVETGQKMQSLQEASAAAATATKDFAAAAESSRDSLAASVSNIQAKMTEALKPGFDTATSVVTSFKDALVQASTALQQNFIGALTGSKPGTPKSTTQPGGIQTGLMTVTSGPLMDIQAQASQITTTLEPLKSSFEATATVSKALTDAMSDLTGATQTAAKASSTTTVKTGTSTDVGANQTLLGAFHDLFSSASSLSDKMGDFQGILSSTMPAVGGFMSAARGTGGPFQAGITGATSGASLGGSVGGAVGSAANSIGGSISSISSIAGPIGSAVGAAVGLAIGIFSGKAQAEAEKIGKQLQLSFEKVGEELGTQQISLQSAISQEGTIIQSAISQLSGKKGGRKELQQILPGMMQQLTQLQAQQEQIFENMDNQVQLMEAPVQGQQYIQSIQQIITTYEQYIQAGGNVTTANAYLQQSFENLGQTDMTTFENDQETAIQNALSYNDLLTQRQNLIASTQQQIDQLIVGSLPQRQWTAGQTKLQQIQQLEYNRDQQLDQMNQEINIAGYKLQVEQQIFNLASTRVALEAQLLTLQEAQTQQDIVRITALQNVIATLNGATGTPGGAQSLAGTFGPGGTVNIAALMAALGYAAANPGLAAAGAAGSAQIASTQNGIQTMLNAVYKLLGLQGQSQIYGTL